MERYILEDKKVTNIEPEYRGNRNGIPELCTISPYVCVKNIMFPLEDEKKNKKKLPDWQSKWLNLQK